ncbi:MAG: hypothetical protein AAFS10_04025 [Myxococcota bacterium]
MLNLVLDVERMAATFTDVLLDDGRATGDGLETHQGPRSLELVDALDEIRMLVTPKRFSHGLDLDRNSGDEHFDQILHVGVVGEVALQGFYIHKRYLRPESPWLDQGHLVCSDNRNNILKFFACECKSFAPP